MGSRQFHVEFSIQPDRMVVPESTKQECRVVHVSIEKKVLSGEHWGSEKEG